MAEEKGGQDARPPPVYPRTTAPNGLFASQGGSSLVERTVHDVRDPSRYDVNQQQVRAVTHPAITGWRRPEAQRRIVVVEVRTGEENRRQDGAGDPTAIAKPRWIAKHRPADAGPPAPLAQEVMRRTMPPTRRSGSRRRGWWRRSTRPVARVRRRPVGALRRLGPRASVPRAIGGLLGSRHRGGQQRGSEYNAQDFAHKPSFGSRPVARSQC